MSGQGRHPFLAQFSAAAEPVVQAVEPAFVLEQEEVAVEVLTPVAEAKKPAASKAEKPHYHGHRKRLRDRFLQAGPDAVSDYELLEMVLFPAKPQGDVKPLAKQLIARFGGFAGVMNAEVHELRKMDGVGDAAVGAIKVVRAAAEKLLQGEAAEKPVLQSWDAVLDYCRVAMAHRSVEEFRILFLNHRNMLLRDEVQQRGTVNHTPVYPREVVKRALEFGASALILLHNHPSGDASPSKADIDVTLKIQQACITVGIQLHDHVIIGGKEHFSLRAHGLI
jgi:DNA repair protein RadC